MRKFLFYFAATGWTLGLTAHLLSIADIDVQEKVPYIWILHIGIFIVWLPTIFDLRKNEDLKAYQKAGMLNSLNPFGVFKVIFKNTPNWLKMIAIIGFYYAFVNFVYLVFMTSSVGTPDIKDGQFTLQDHGQFIRTLTSREYHHYKAAEMRLFSGHWIAFYGLAMAVLYPVKKQSQELPNY
jgi:hypothetical protein